MGPGIIVPLAAFAMAIILGIGIPIAKAFARRMDADSRQPRVPNEVAERLERMERAIEAVAIEVEAHLRRPAIYHQASFRGSRSR